MPLTSEQIAAFAELKRRGGLSSDQIAAFDELQKRGQGAPSLPLPRLEAEQPQSFMQSVGEVTQERFRQGKDLYNKVFPGPTTSYKDAQGTEHPVNALDMGPAALAAPGEGVWSVGNALRNVPLLGRFLPNSEGLMTTAANLRAGATPPGIPSGTAPAAILNTATNLVRRPAASVLEKTAKALASQEGPAAPAITALTSRGEIPFPNAPQSTPNVQFRKPSAPAPEIPFPNAPPPRTSDVQFRQPSAPADEIPFPNAPQLTPLRPAPLDPAQVNRWMGVSAKEVAHGANPGEQLIADKLVGATKAETQANVKAALETTGQEMQALLKTAGDEGVRLDGSHIITDALEGVRSKLKSPTDSAFAKRIDTLFDKILERYPDIDHLTPQRAHALKVELGKNIDWRATADDPLNDAFIQAYGEVNTAIKTGVQGIAPIQRKWGNLSVADRNLTDSRAENLVGRGSPDAPPLAIKTGPIQQ